MASTDWGSRHARKHDSHKETVVTPESELRAEKRRHQAETAILKKTISDLQSKVKHLSITFEEINKKLVAISPKPHVSDREIANGYEELCQDIEDWVDKHHADIDNSTTPSLSTDDAASRRTEIEMLLDKGAAMKILDEYHDCKDHILTKLIMRFLFDNLLRRARWLPGLSTEQEKVLQIVMDNLSHGTNDGGFDMQNSWKFNTYCGLAASSKMQKLRDEALERMKLRLSDLTHWFLGSESDRTKQNELGKLIQTAADLADMMRLCPVQYCFVYAFSNNMDVESRLLKAIVDETYIVVDVVTGLSVGEERFRQSDNGEVIGQIHTVILPNLVKLNSDGTVVKLARGALLAKLDESGSEKEADAPANTPPDTEREGDVVEKKASDSKKSSAPLPALMENSTWASLLK